MSWSSIHASLLSDFINALDSNGIRYFILRNYEELPLNNIAKDVDIVIEPGKYNVAVKFLNSLFLKYDFYYPYVAHFEKLHCVYGANTIAHHAIHIDLIEGYRHKGFELISFEEYYKHTKIHNGLKVLDDDYDTILLFYHKLFQSKHFITRYRTRILSGLQKTPSVIQKCLIDFSGKKIGNFIFKTLLDGNFEELENAAKRISIVTKTRTIFKQPVKTSCSVLYFLFQKFYWIVLCPKRCQKFFAVLGPDGVGKSTFIDLLVKEINYYSVADGDKCIVYHHRPSMLPNLGAMGEQMKFMKEDKNFTQPHRKKPAGFFGSFFRMFYYFSDYFIFMPILVRRNAKWDNYVIFDRYIYDFLIDPLRSRIDLPFFIRKFFASLVVKPRLVFILYTDCETIYQRKQELSKPELQRQLMLYRKLVSSSSRFVLLDASQTPERLVHQAMNCILKKISSKI